jgi:hypothetical protein
MTQFLVISEPEDKVAFLDVVWDVDEVFEQRHGLTGGASVGRSSCFVITRTTPFVQPVEL